MASMTWGRDTMPRARCATGGRPRTGPSSSGGRTVLVEQSMASTITEGVTLNGRLTLGENIADLGGLTISLAALHEVTGTPIPRRSTA